MAPLQLTYRLLDYSRPVQRATETSMVFLQVPEVNLLRKLCSSLHVTYHMYYDNACINCQVSPIAIAVYPGTKPFRVIRRKKIRRNLQLSLGSFRRHHCVAVRLLRRWRHFPYISSMRR